MKQRKYGLVFDEPKTEDYVFGASLPIEILQANGDWTDFLPTKEFQAPYNFETFACVTFTVLNCVEILIKRQYGIEKNYSDRFLAIVSGTKAPGNSPRTVCDFLRKIGVVPEELWPYNNSVINFEKWATPIPPKLYELAREFNNEFDFRYEQVPLNHNSISQALKCSPLLISVSAWFSKDDKYFRPEGMTDNHATTMFYERAGEFRRIFDSYDKPHIKDVEWEAIPQMAIRFWIKKKAEVAQRISLIQRIINLMLSLVGLMKEQEATKPTPPPISPPVSIQPQPEPIKPTVLDFANAIQVFEGWFPPSAEYPNGTTSWRNKNPGNIRGANGSFLKFPTADAGFKYLCDYIRRVARNEHKAYPKDCDIKQFFLVYAPVGDNNHPISYGVWVAHRLGVTPSFLVKDLV